MNHSGSRYFLIARDRATNRYQIISTSPFYGSSLEEIDLFTTDFADEKELTKYLKGRDYPLGDSTDFYIVTQVKKLGTTYLRKWEVLYADSREVQNIADCSVHQKIAKSGEQIEKLYNRFFAMLERRPAFFNFVTYGDVSLYKNFTDKLPAYRMVPAYSLKYGETNWITKSYILIRNVYETISRFELQKNYSSEREARTVLDPELLRVTHKNFDPDQFSFFEEETVVKEDEDGFQR